MAPVSAFAAVPVHVASPGSTAPDTCAICHRAHTATEQLGYLTTESTSPVGNALIQASEPGRGDVGLCYTCHGIAALGASADVETSLTLSSAHLVAPSASPTFGPNPKMCGSCHDPHGTDKTPTGDSFPRLLRAWSSTAATVTAGEEYCDTCHAGRSAAGSRYLGRATYRLTGHYTRFPDPASGTRIRCMGCHEAHGSNVAPLIKGRVTRPSALGAASETTVTANDRTFCVACHDADLGTWSNPVAYSGSSHAKSATTTAIPGEWPAPGATRKLGECQVCHAPMGARDGNGDLIADLVARRGRDMCDQCHQPKPAGLASTDLESLAYVASESTQLELAAVYGTATQTVTARVSVYARHPDGVTTRLLGPREYRAAGATSTAAAGDVMGDAAAELVVAKVDAVGGHRLTVYQRDPLLGIATTALWNVTVSIQPDFLAVGRFIGSPGKDQIAIVEASSGRVRVYGVNGTGTALTGPVFSGTLPVGSAASGLASGDLTGTVAAELVITDPARDELHILQDDGFGGMSITTTATGAAHGVTGPSIGNAVSAAGTEIVVCNAAVGTISVYDSAGAELGEYAVDDGGGDAVPVASAVADVKGDATNEVCVALSSATGMNYVNIFEASGGGLGAASRHDTGSMYGSGTLAAGDVNGDGQTELIVGNAGLWDTSGGMVAPSVQVVRVQIGWMTGIQTYPAGGAELAGRAPALAVADFGAVLPSRHPIDEVDVSHNSTETAPFDRHVTCTDCHNPHEANADTAFAPLIGGRLRGSRGVTASGVATRSVNQYETCYKCHTTTAGGRRDISSEVDPANASVHAVEASSTSAAANSATFETGWSNDSILYCTDCHGNAASPPEPKGGHRSTASPVLKSPILGVGPDDAAGLCYDCHVYALYRNGTGDDGSTGSAFYLAGSPGTPLHKRHSGAFASGGLEISCLACHVSHGTSTKAYLLRSDVDTDVDARSCTNDCHGGTARAY